MGFQTSVHPREGYLVFSPAGEITSQALAELGEFIRGTCEEKDIRSALVDSGKIEGALGITELYHASVAFMEKVGRGIRVAYINPPPHWKPEDDEYSRNVIYNSGYELPLFPSEEKAVPWLTGTP